MKKRRIGPFQVAEIGLGCMNVSHAYGPATAEDEAVALFQGAIDRGVDHFDTAALYGFGTNETVVGKALKGRRDQVMLASKCGLVGVDGKRVVDGSPACIRQTCEGALTRLQTDVIDLYYLHRLDPKVPIEDSVGALADLVTAGKVRTIGLSEVSAATLRRAHAVHPISALQTEYSLWSRNAEVAVLDACAELGTTFVAFSPVARGFLAGGVREARFAEGDIRRSMPRFMEPQFSHNLALLEVFGALAAQAGCTMGQLALAWLLHRAPHIVPIPGTTSMAHLEENMGASEVALTDEIAAQADALINTATVQGHRYAPAAQADIDTEDVPTAA